MIRLLTLLLTLTIFIRPVYTDQTLCNICTTVVQMEQQQLKDNSGSLDQFDDFVRSLCDMIQDPNQQDQCLHILSIAEADTKWFISADASDVCNRVLNDTCNNTKNMKKQMDTSPSCMTCLAMGTVIDVTDKMNLSHSILPSIFQSICSITQVSPCPVDRLDDMLDCMNHDHMTVQMMCQHELLCEEEKTNIPLVVRSNVVVQNEKKFDTWCDMCQLLVNAEQLQLQAASQNLTDADQYVRSICNMLTDPAQHKQCLLFVSQLEQNTEWILNTDSKTICSKLANGVCDGQEYAKSTNQMIMPLEDHPDCVVCHMMGNIIKVSEKMNLSRDGLPSILTSLCQLTQLSPCPLNKLPGMITSIDAGLSVKDMCINEQMCGPTKGNEKQVIQPKQPQDTILCQVCQIVISGEQIVLKLVSGVLVVADEIAHAICDNLQEPTKQNCYDWLSGAETNTTWLINNPPKEICSTWFPSICDASSQQTDNAIDLSMNLELYQRPIPVSCIACQIMGSLITVTESWKLPRDNLPNMFNTICQLTKLSPCPVSKLESMLLAIDMGISVQQMCVNEKMCPIKQEPQVIGIARIRSDEDDDVTPRIGVASILPYQPILKQQSNNKISTSCTTCIGMISTIQSAHRHNHPIYGFFRSLSIEICLHLGGSLSNTCIQLIDEMTSGEMLMISSPSEICSDFLVTKCDVQNSIQPRQLLLGSSSSISTTSMIAHDSQLLQSKPIACMTCHLYTTLMSIISESNPGSIEMNIDQWITILYSMCSEYQQNCSNLMDSIPTIIRWQEKGFTPIQICQYIDVCPAISQ